jgi:hypothetical protein
MKPQRTIDFNKVQWADYFYVTRLGQRSRTKPTGPTVNGQRISITEYAYPFYNNYPAETCYERAKRCDLIDVWKPVCILHVTANRCLTYTGVEAVKIWRQYNAHIYGK